VIEAVNVEAVGGAGALPGAREAEIAGAVAKPERATRFFSNGQWRKARVYSREKLALGARVKGPALIIEPHQTIVVEAGWRAHITQKNHVILQRVDAMARREAIGAKADPVIVGNFQQSVHVDRRTNGP